MSKPLEHLQFTEEEIDHGVAELVRQTQGGSWPYAAEAVRAVLRAVRAVPARCLNGYLAGEPAAVGTEVQGTGLNGRSVRGTVRESYPVTTVVVTPYGQFDYLWTNTIRSWDPSTTRARVVVDSGMVTGRIVLDPGVPDGRAWIIPEGHEGRLYDPEPVIGPPVASKARITISADDLRADDDGMTVEEGR